MTILRPITSKSPCNVDVQEGSGIPFGFILTPFGNSNDLPQGDDDEFAARERQLKLKRHDDSNGNVNGGSQSNSKSKSTYECHQTKIKTKHPLKASLLAKCHHCGSPLNPSSPFVTTWMVLCSLCGKTFSVDYQTQYETKMRMRGSIAEDDADTDADTYANQYASNEREYRSRYARTQSLEECSRPLMEYSLPLLSMPVPNTNQKAAVDDIYALPAQMCPPLLAIFIDATCTEPRYYNFICQRLKKLFDAAGKGRGHGHEHEHERCKSTRVGIFCMTPFGGLSIFDLSNPGGHLKHLWVKEENHVNDDDGDDEVRGDAELKMEVPPLANIMTADQIFVPLDSDFSKSCVESALRALEDSSITVGLACHRQRYKYSGHQGQNRRSGSGSQSGSGGACLGSTLRYFLDFMEDVGYHPGEAQAYNTGANEVGFNRGGHDQNVEPYEKFMYAGGKIMCFLSGPPDEIGHAPVVKGENIDHGGGRIGMGGHGGTCAEIGKRFSNVDGGDTGRSGHSHAHFSDDDVQVDIEFGDNRDHGLVRADDNKEKDNKNLNAKAKVKSMKGIQEEQIPQTKYKHVAEYYQEIGKSSAVGAFAIEVFGLLDGEHERHGNKVSENYLGIPLLRLLSDRSGGTGPIIVAFPSDNDASDMDQADILMKEIEARSPWKRNHAFGAAFRIRLPPSLRIDKDKALLGTGRKSINTVHKTDKLYQSKGVYGSVSASDDDDDGLFFIGACDDSHTLSFNVKISLSSGSIIDNVFVDGRGDIRLNPCIQICFAYTTLVNNSGKLVTVRRLRVLTSELKLTDSVESLTLSLDPEALAVHSLKYGLSAVEEYAINWMLSVLLCCYQSAKKVNSNVSRYGPNVVDEFYPCDRLLDIGGGKLSKEDILLGKGHVGLQCLPLLVFALIQCDALRPKSGDFNPSLDARAAAAANMGNMPPSALARSIAPRIELWLGGEQSTEPVHEAVDMNMNDLRYAIIENIEHYDGDNMKENYTGPIPLLLIDSPRHVLIYDCRELCNLRPSVMNDIPNAMKKMVDESIFSYRVAPASSCFVGYGNSAPKEAIHHLLDAMVEDSFNSKGESYKQWCTRIAEILYSEISSHKL